ncbi:cytoskeletal protein CcmA (bactofilin family) [Desulfitispora alkaliphila]|uniref:bactofilin family protein n=1 Tax=Desulfitispora alkaliphila TaxID=622674 RepID=UPI003D24C6D4
MFKRKQQEEANFEKVDTLIGKETAFQGNLNASGTVRIDGKLEGDINCNGDLVIGETGVVKANIKARNILLSGEVEGNLSTQGKIELTTAGKLVGDIVVGKLIIDEGAVFKGRCDMKYEKGVEKIEKVKPKSAEA